MEKADLKRAGFMNAVKNGGDIWFCNVYNSTLVRFNVETGEIHIETFLPARSLTGKIQYGAIAVYKNLLVIAPRNAESIQVYDINLKELKEISLSISADGERINNLFVSVQICNGVAYFFPGKYPGIVTLDLNSFEVKCYSDWIDTVYNLMPDQKSVICNEVPVLIDDTYFIPLYRADGILKFNIDVGVTELCMMSVDKTMISGFKFDGKYFWISYADTNNLARWDYKNNQTDIFNLDLDGYKATQGFAMLFCYNDLVILVPKTGNMLVAFDKKEERFRRFTTQEFCCESPKLELVLDKRAFLGTYMIEDKLILYSSFEGKIYYIDCESEDVFAYDAYFSRDEDVFKIKKIYISRNEILMEKHDVSLEDFIDFVEKKECEQLDSVVYTIGEKIWKDING